MGEKIDFKDFQKVEMKVGKIKSVEDHPNADKLLVMKVDLGEGEDRTIVAGLRKYYSSEELVGKKAIFVANLAPASLRGVESNGMIMAAVSEDHGEVKVLKPSKDCEAGSLVEFKHG
ncbi:MAG: methionine--tRNA ligase subunit beta [Nanoarchaeota archaeon]|nr:methionine--tRNA ligase subunit beta [Nanoarchaeota archaeon]